ncbi:MAG: energy transducer TonB [bacterium]|nr:energy transducer TonB [bacterium]
MKTEPVGGNEQLEQVLQTQLTLPKTILYSDYHDNIEVFIIIDSAGNASKSIIKSTINNLLVQKEVKRLLKFMKFKKSLPDPLIPYELSLSLSVEKYKHYYKQKSKFLVKSELPADSSFSIHSHADRSPEYFKNGEEGLNGFLLTELEYPKLAIEKSLEGTVVIEFVVETNGFVTGLRAVRNVSGGCTEEAMRLIKKTKWQPAELNGELVRYKTSYPITFSLRNVNRNVGYSSQTLGQ